jgi:uncharacterized protein
MYVSNLIIILKISEVCPLACDYCYHFRNIVSPHKTRPIKIEKNVIHKLCDGIMKLNGKEKISHVSFSLHGGEPLSIGKDYFVEICDIIVNTLKVSHSFIYKLMPYL